MKDRILSNIEINDDGCWVWPRSTSGPGYGQFIINKKHYAAHRVAYEEFKGAIPKGKLVRHTCHNRRCCNPDHLKLGSHLDNWHDSKEAHKEAHKKRGTTVQVGDMVFESLREACRELGLTSHSICKFTTDGVFDIEAYREACSIAGWNPKV